jgi:hypothetical protein
MPSSKYLTEAEVDQILKQVDDQRSFSSKDILLFTKSLNRTLARYRMNEATRKGPTQRQLVANLDEFRKALKKLKSALPSEHSSLWNYLVYLGERFAERRGAHRNLVPQFALGYRPDGETFEIVDHYRSDERLQELVSSVPQVLDWISHGPALTKPSKNEKGREPSAWRDHTLHWLDERNIFDEWKPQNPRLLNKLELVGYELANEYRRIFGKAFTTSRLKNGRHSPGVGFVLAVLKSAGISIKSDTIIRYRTEARKGLRRRSRVGNVA